MVLHLSHLLGLHVWPQKSTHIQQACQQGWESIARSEEIIIAIPPRPQMKGFSEIEASSAPCRIACSPVWLAWQVIFPSLFFLVSYAQQGGM